MKRTVLKCLLAIVVVLFLAAAVFVGWLLMRGDSPAEKREVVSVWYSNKPYSNTLTFYDNGAYTSESFGTAEGTYEVVSDSEWILTDEAGFVREAKIDGNMLTFRVDNIVHEYYNSPDLLQEGTGDDDNVDEEIDYGLISLRLTMAQKLLDQGDWTGDGHTLEGTMTALTIDGKEYDYTVDEVFIKDEETMGFILNVGGEEKTMLMTVDDAARTYTIDLDGMIFTTPGENLRLDS